MAGLISQTAQKNVTYAQPDNMPGLSPKQRMGMMGQPQSQVAQAHRQAQRRQARQINRKRQLEEEEKLREKLADGIKKFTGTVGAVTVGFLALKGVMGKFSEEILEGTRGISHWSGQLASAFAQLDVQRMLLDRRSAMAQEGSASTLADAVMEYRESNQPNVEAFNTFKNTAGIVAARIGTVMAEVQNWFLENSGLKRLLDQIEDNTRGDREPGGTPTGVTIRRLARRNPLDPLP